MILLKVSCTATGSGMYESLLNMSKERAIGLRLQAPKGIFLVGVKWSEKSGNHSVGGTVQRDLGGSIGTYHPNHATCQYCPLTSPPDLCDHAMDISLPYPMTWLERDQRKHHIV